MPHSRLAALRPQRPVSRAPRPRAPQSTERPARGQSTSGAWNLPYSPDPPGSTHIITEDAHAEQERNKQAQRDAQARANDERGRASLEGFRRIAARIIELVRSCEGDYVTDPADILARAWVDENIGKDNGFQPYYPTVIIEPRYLEAILEGIEGDGLDYA